MNRFVAPMPQMSAMDSTLGPQPVLEPALLGDMARMFRQLGIESFRASVVDMGSMAFQAAWTITDSGEVSDNNPDKPLDSQFPGAMATITQLADAPAEQTVVQRLSPRRWTFAWRIDSLHVVIAEARYRDMRASVSQIDTALVRLVCDTGIRSGTITTTVHESEDERALVWPSSQERRSGRQRSPLAARLALGLSVASAGLALWLALVALPEVREGVSGAQANAARLRSITNSTMVRGLSAALATGDYGEVQTELSNFESLGYFQTAVVTNARQRIVSMSKGTEGLRIGIELPAELARTSTSFDLAMGSERYGQLLVLKSAMADPIEGRFGAIRLASLAAFATSALAALMMVLRIRRSRRASD